MINNNVEVKTTILSKPEDLVIPNKIQIDEDIALNNIKTIGKDELLNGISKLLDKKVELFLGFEGSPYEVTETILYKAIDNNQYAYYAVYDKEDFSGIFYLYNIKCQYKKANISFGLAPKKRGRVLNLDRICILITKLFEIGFNRLSFEIEDTNKDSLLIAKHLQIIGFMYEGKLQDNYGFGIHSNVYTLLRRNYKSIKKEQRQR